MTQTTGTRFQYMLGPGAVVPRIPDEPSFLIPIPAQKMNPVVSAAVHRDVGDRRALASDRWHCRLRKTRHILKKLRIMIQLCHQLVTKSLFMSLPMYLSVPFKRNCKNDSLLFEDIATHL